VLVGLVAALALPGAGGADPSAQADALRGEQTTLAARSHAALLSLYSLDSQLAQARARVASLHARAAAVRKELRQVAREEAIAHHAWLVSVHALGDHLRTLYEQGEPNAIGVLLGATSIDDAVSNLDALERSARVNRQTIAQTRRAQRALASFQRRLDQREQELHALAAQAEQTTFALERTRVQRTAYISSLERQRNFDARRIARLEAVARAGANRSQIVVAAETPTVAPTTPISTPAATNGSTLTVTATGYSLDGYTAMGLPVGWGIVAVDPSVIPLGTRLSIPGYGDGVAADTGGAVRGATIDLWFPSQAQALAWGRRTVTVTLH
jgi:3D (Asp-Asp-Asp) domain-containing protein